jgi:hypothetical protein
MSLRRSIKRKLRTILDEALVPFETRCEPGSSRYQKLEARVPPYTLPDPLTLCNGNYVRDTQSWRMLRRQELLELFRSHVYGHSPQVPPETPFEVLSVNKLALGGLATRKEVRVALTGTTDGPSMTLLLYVPNQVSTTEKRVPVFLGLNFFGNHTVHPDPSISITGNWIPDNSLTEGRVPAESRGLQSSSWPVEFLLRRGYGLATAYCGDIVPDRPDGLGLGILGWYREKATHAHRKDSWGVIAGWAWGLSRAMDYLEGDTDVHSGRIAVMGHSRLGKAALWAGAQDERFALVISNESGCGGATLFRRRFGETVAQINAKYPHWFCEAFKQYGDREHLLPVDQHELLALVAPRPVYVASAQLDLQADPMGEFLAAKNATAVYGLLGNVGLPAEELPPAGAPVMGRIGYHIRRGRHAITPFDWSQFVAFANKHLGES